MAARDGIKSGIDSDENQIEAARKVIRQCDEFVFLLHFEETNSVKRSNAGSIF